MYKIAIVGACGNFGSIIYDKLLAQEGVSLLPIGRDQHKLSELTQDDSYWCGDAHSPEFEKILKSHQIDLVIHTAGPFQGQDYAVARASIAAGANYCDLADCRHFVNGIATLNEQAKEAGVFVLSGCSSVPALSSAVIDHLRPRFSKIQGINFGLSSSSKMPGVSTIRGVLEYAGKPIEQFKDGRAHRVYGWQDLTLKRFEGAVYDWKGLRLRKFDGLGRRLLANVDVPDMDIFPTRYGAQEVRFQAGSGIAGTLAIYGVAWLARLGIIRNGASCADWLHKLGRKLEPLRNPSSLMFIKLTGIDTDGNHCKHQWEIEAGVNRGPIIPASGSVALALMHMQGKSIESGARPCAGVVSLESYLEAVDHPFIATRSISTTYGQSRLGQTKPFPPHDM